MLAFCFNSTALAGGWVNSAQEVEFDTIYTEGWNADDPTTKPGSGYKYATFNCDAFKFVVPQKGNINVNIKSAFGNILLIAHMFTQLMIRLNR